MPCGCKKRMKKLEEKAPKVAEAIRPIHEVAMKVMDRLGVGDPEPEEPSGEAK